MRVCGPTSRDALVHAQRNLNHTTTLIGTSTLQLHRAVVVLVERRPVDVVDEVLAAPAARAAAHRYARAATPSRRAGTRRPSLGGWVSNIRRGGSSGRVYQFRRQLELRRRVLDIFVLVACAQVNQRRQIVKTMRGLRVGRPRSSASGGETSQRFAALIFAKYQHILRWRSRDLSVLREPFAAVARPVWAAIDERGSQRSFEARRSGVVFEKRIERPKRRVRLQAERGLALVERRVRVAPFRDRILDGAGLTRVLQRRKRRCRSVESPPRILHPQASAAAAAPAPPVSAAACTIARPNERRASSNCADLTTARRTATPKLRRLHRPRHGTARTAFAAGSSSIVAVSVASMSSTRARAGAQWRRTRQRQQCAPREHAAATSRDACRHGRVVASNAWSAIAATGVLRAIRVATAPRERSTRWHQC